MTELILAYVPESEHLVYNEACDLALERDRQAADALRLSVPDSEKLLTPDGLIARMARHGIRQNIVLEPPGSKPLASSPNGYILARMGNKYIKLWDIL